MKEAQDKVVIWKEVDKQTFALFSEFAHTWEYTLPNGVEDQAHGSGLESPLPTESTTSELEQDFKRRRRKILNVVSVQVPEQKRANFGIPFTFLWQSQPRYLFESFHLPPVQIIFFFCSGLSIEATLTRFGGHTLQLASGAIFFFCWSTTPWQLFYEFYFIVRLQTWCWDSLVNYFLDFPHLRPSILPKHSRNSVRPL